MAKKKKSVVKPLNFDTPLSPTGKDRPPPPSIVIPPTPSPSNGPISLEEMNSPTPGSRDPWGFLPTPETQLSPLSHRLNLNLSPISDVLRSQGEDLDLNAASIASPEILALANFQSSIKHALSNLSSTIGRLEVQNTRMQQLGVDIRIHEQVTLLRAEVEEQIRRQKADLETVKQGLEAKVKAALTIHIKAKLHAAVKETVSKMVQDKVYDELNKQIPDKLRDGLLGHQRQIQEVKTSIHNSEARRYNASLQSASLTVPLRPLLRPLPTPEQSPYPTLATTSVPNSRLPSALPLSAYPCPPAPTPIRRSTSAFAASCGPISRSHSHQHMAPTPSALFPKDLKSLFALGPDAAKTLLREYGLESTAPSPVTLVEEPALAITAGPRLKAPKIQRRSTSSTIPTTVHQPSIPEESDTEEGTEEEEESIKAHVQDMNTFMAHIGVPFLMVPPPKQKETNAEKRRKKLAPLIINAAPAIR